MARKPTGGPVGRPEKEIDWNMYEQLCGIHCTTQEIASFLKVHEDTLRPRAVQHYGGDDYSAIYKKFQESGKCSLRRNQFAMSKTNASMAIWLGKQYLGQSDGLSKDAQDIIKSLSDIVEASHTTKPESQKAS